ncbi:hypothetical protein E3G68_005045 [Mycobacteroides abscessus]|nr:hypothetical protein [Mycobacteroides abscessus]
MASAIDIGGARVRPIRGVVAPLPAGGRGDRAVGSLAEVPRSRQQPRQLFVRTDDGVTLHLTARGPRNAPCTVVFLHGLCLSQGSWAPQIDSVLDGFGPSVQAVCYDHRGHGRSMAGAVDSYTIDRLADDLDVVLTAVAPAGSVVLIGHSMGAMAALTHCARHAGATAWRVDGLVLAATAAGHLTQFGLGQLLTAPGVSALLRLLQGAPDPALGPLRRLLAGPVCRGVSHWHGSRYGCLLAEVAADALATTPLRTAVGFLPALAQFDQYSALGSIRARTVVISGGADLLTPAVLAEDIVAMIPGSRHLHLPHCGHMVHQAREELDAAIASVITDVIAEGQRGVATLSPRLREVRA